MNIQRAGALIFTMIATSAMGAVTTTVVDVPTRGVTQRFLYVHPDAPVANILVLPGGDGLIGIPDDGNITAAAFCTPFARNRQAFADDGFAVAVVDAASDGVVWDFSDMLAVIRYMRARDNVPTWITGGSAATAATWNLAINLPIDMPVGAIFFSPGRPSTSQVALIKRPTLVIYNELDDMQFGAAFFAALTSAPVKEQVSFAGGNNGACGGIGYHVFGGLDAEFAAATTGFIDKYNGTLGPPVAANYQGLWYAAPAGSEAGWGINFTHQGDTIFASWFTFDLTGKGLWLVMTATKTGNGAYAGTLFQLTGPPFDAVPFPPLGSPGGAAGTVVGTGTLSFTGANDASFAYTVNGIFQTKAITRQVFGTLPTCAYNAQPNFALATNYQDLWYAAPAESEAGWGVNLTHQGDTIFASWFTFDHDRTPMWLVVSALKTAPGTYTGTLYRLTGPAFNAVPFPPLGSPGGAIGTSVGTATFTFTDGATGTFAYTVNGATQTKNITRQLFQPPAGTVCK